MQINYKLVRARMATPEAVKRLADLNALKVDIDELIHKQHVMEMQYFVSRCDYEKYLGYPLSDKDLKEYEDYVDTLKSLKID